MSPPWSDVLDSFRSGNPTHEASVAVFEHARMLARVKASEESIAVGAAGEVVIQLASHAPNIKDVDHLLAWLVVATRNRVVDIFRRRKRQPTHEPLGDHTVVVDPRQPIEALTAEELRRELFATIEAWVDHDDADLRRDLLRAIARDELELEAEPPEGISPRRTPRRNAHRKLLRHLHDAVRALIACSGIGELRRWTHLRAKDDAFHVGLIQSWLGSLHPEQLEKLLPRGRSVRRRALLRTADGRARAVEIANTTPGGYGVVFVDERAGDLLDRLDILEVELEFLDVQPPRSERCVIRRFGPVSFAPSDGAPLELRPGLGLARIAQADATLEHGS